MKGYTLSFVTGPCRLYLIFKSLSHIGLTKIQSEATMFRNQDRAERARKECFRNDIRIKKYEG